MHHKTLKGTLKNLNPIEPLKEPLNPRPYKTPPKDLSLSAIPREKRHWMVQDLPSQGFRGLGVRGLGV